MSTPEKRPRMSVPDDNVLFWNLRRHGAPLSKRGSPGLELSLEETLSFGLALSRRYPSVAQVWPVVFGRNQSAVDLDVLTSLARELEYGHVLGFFLSVVGRLLDNSDLEAYLDDLRKERGPELEDFFLMGQGRLYRELSEKNTPQLAREWGFRMNTSVEDFKSCFDKFMRLDESLRK